MIGLIYLGLSVAKWYCATWGHGNRFTQSPSPCGLARPGGAGVRQI